MLAHGFGVDFADGDAFGCFGVACCGEFAVAVLAVDAPAAELGWLAGPAPFADVVLPGFGVVLALDDGVGVGVEVGDPVGDGDPAGEEDEVGAGDLLGGDE